MFPQGSAVANIFLAPVGLGYKEKMNTVTGSERREGAAATASREFQVFAKPAGAACNMDCRYCYYLEKEAIHRDTRESRMSRETLETLIVEQLQASPGPVVRFSWHGGEPTLMGLEYFRLIVSLQQAHRAPGQRVLNGIQTNGILIDEEWCRFLAAGNFHVGLSMDGPAELHDKYRLTKGHRPTHSIVMRALGLLQRHKVRCDVLCVVHDMNVREPARVYRFFKKIGARSLTFLPLVQPLPLQPGRVTAETVPPDAYGDFLCAIFDEWVAGDSRRVAVQQLDEAIRPALGQQHSLCVFRKTCGDVPVVEHNGDFYACDHFVDAEHRLGNISSTPLVELLESSQQRDFGNAKLEKMPRYCRDCPVLPMCNGGCPKDRFATTPAGEPGLNYLCPGFKRFFTHVLPYAVKLAASHAVVPQLDELVSRHRPTSVGGNAIGRNDPCPCGSGLKHKKCCLRS
jgi:uncharacterized protein